MFLTNFGPLTGPILYRDAPPALGVFRDQVVGMPIGVAYPTGYTPREPYPAAVFRLGVEGVDPDARWVCVGRVFVELGEAAG
jgi:hypothetical protein